jgi:hypothetical protein
MDIHADRTADHLAKTLPQFKFAYGTCTDIHTCMYFYKMLLEIQMTTVKGEIKKSIHD